MSIRSYDTPQHLKRPHKSFRFDVFSLKASRRMMLYGKPALCQFIELEADPLVSALCERPLKIPDLKPERMVDFWAIRNGRPAFYLLLGKQTARDLEKPKLAMEDFRKWVAAEKAVLHEIVVDVFDDRRIWHGNWTTVLQHLVAHHLQVTPKLLQLCVSAMPNRFTLTKIEGLLSDQDSMLVRAGVFALLASGTVICPSMRNKYLCPDTEFVKS